MATSGDSMGEPRLSVPRHEGRQARIEENQMRQDKRERARRRMRHGGWRRGDGQSSTVATATGRAASQSSAQARPFAHPLAWLLLALAVSALSAFALTAAFSDGSVFASPTDAIEDAVSYAYMRGPVAVSLTYAAAAMVNVAGLARFARADTRTRAWSVAMGLVLALTLVFDKHPTSHTVEKTAAAVTEPAVWPGQMNAAYWTYHGLRFVGFAALTIAASTLFLTAMTAWLDRRGTAAVTAARTDAGTDPTWHPTWHPTRDLLAAASARLARLETPARRLFSTPTPRHVCALWGGVTLCWLPWMVLLWPANLLSDTVAQIVWWRTRANLAAWDPSSAQALPGYAMSDQHPWLDTVIYGVVDELGVRMGAEAWTMWALAVAQTALCALAFAVMIVHLGSRMRVPWQACAAMAGFVALNPLFPRLMMTLVKDSTSMPFFLLLMTMTMEWIRRARAGERAGFALPAGIVAAAVMCDLTRKIALEILAGTFLVLAVVLTGRRLASLALALVPVALVMGISAVAMPALHVAPGGRQEMLAIPLQQSALTLVRDGDALPVADRKAMEAVFQCDVARMATILHQDPGDGDMIDRGDAIKDGCYNRAATGAQVGAFLAAWARQMPAHLGDYIDAVPWLRDPFVMGDWYNESWNVRAGWETKGSEAIVLPEYRGTVDNLPVSGPQQVGRAIYMAATSLPPSALLMRENTYVVWVPMAALALCGVRRRCRDWVYLTPWLLTIGSLALLPGHQSRYTWTLAYGAIMIAAIPLIGGLGEGAAAQADAHADAAEGEATHEDATAAAGGNASRDGEGEIEGAGVIEAKGAAAR